MLEKEAQIRHQPQILIRLQLFSGKKGDIEIAPFGKKMFCSVASQQIQSIFYRQPFQPAFKSRPESGCGALFSSFMPKYPRHKRLHYSKLWNQSQWRHFAETVSSVAGKQCRLVETESEPVEHRCSSPKRSGAELEWSWSRPKKASVNRLNDIIPPAQEGQSRITGGGVNDKGETAVEKMIEVAHLTKYYGDLLAVDEISFYVETGKLFSFLGPNGAGKSTTIDILCTLLDFDSGDCVIGGYDLRRESQKIREITGIVFQDHLLDDLLTVRENLTVRASLYTADRKKSREAADEAIRSAGLVEIAGRPYGKLSGGQRRRADIARALVQKPRILFLDEPTTGLDPQTRKSIWNTIRRLQLDQGMTLFLTTHYMEEAAGSDYVIVIDRGKIVAKGTPAELKTRYTADTLRLYATDEQLLRQKLQELQLSFEVAGGEYIVKLKETLAAVPVLERCRGCISGFQVLQGTMDDAFINIVGEGLVQ